MRFSEYDFIRIALLFIVLPVSILIHELGHAFSAMLFGYDVGHIFFSGRGAYIVITFCENPLQTLGGQITLFSGGLCESIFLSVVAYNRCPYLWPYIPTRIAYAYAEMTTLSIPLMMSITTVSMIVLIASVSLFVVFMLIKQTENDLHDENRKLRTELRRLRAKNRRLGLG
jgi:hypothetical protein